jgi:hypothetical protein
MKITIFSEELRKCLNSAGLSDCGENDTWNYWYQRLMNAYNESVERQIMTEQAENAKLCELVRDMYKAFVHGNCYRWCEFKESCNYISDGRCQWYDRMRELGVEE